MKKLLYTLLAVSVIFSACEKEEEEPTNNTNNNNLSLTIEETIWEVTSFVETYSLGQTFSVNIPTGREMSLSSIFLIISNLSFSFLRVHLLGHLFRIF